MFNKMTVNMDGPYGIPIKTENYNEIYLVAGGIGITPLHSTFRTILK